MKKNAITNLRVKDYLRSHPDTSFEAMVKDLDLTGYSKGYFYALKRKAQGIDKPTVKKSLSTQSEIPGPKATRVEILAQTDAAGFSEEIRKHYQSHFLPLLKRLVPDGADIQILFHSDPPKVEIRRLVR